MKNEYGYGDKKRRSPTFPTLQTVRVSPRPGRWAPGIKVHCHYVALQWGGPTFNKRVGVEMVSDKFAICSVA